MLARDDRPWRGGAPPAVVYSYAPGRSAEHAAALLKGYTGVLQTDGYAAYRSLADPKRGGGPVTLAFCWAHWRRRFFALPVSSQGEEFSFHGDDLGEICCEVVIATALPGHETEAAARECRRRTCAAQMNDRSQLLPLLTADPRVSTMAEDRCDFAVQEYRCKLCGVTRHDPRI